MSTECAPRSFGLPARSNRVVSARDPAFLAAIVLASVVTAPVASAQCSDDASSMSWVWGRSYTSYAPGSTSDGTVGLVKVGTRVFAVDEQVGLLAYDETAPGQLAYRGLLNLLPADVQGLDANATRACVAGGQSGLVVVDISDPTNMSIVGTVEAQGATVVDLEGSYAYVIDWYGLTIVRVAHGLPLMMVGQFPGQFREVVVRRNLAYLLTGGGLWLVDVSNPAQPSFVAVAYASSSLHDLAVQGDYLYVADLTYGVRVFDLANPADPVLVSGAPRDGAWRVIAGPEQLLVGWEGAWTYVHLQSPTDPVVRGTYRGLAGC